MPRWSRRKIGKWVGVAACAVIAGVWVLSGAWNVWYRPRPAKSFSEISLQRGEVIIDIVKTKAPMRLPPSGIRPRFLTVKPSDPGSAGLPRWEWSWPQRAVPPALPSSPRSETLYILPLWLPFGLSLVGTAILFWRDRRSYKPGACPRCGYELAGLPAGTACPECGTV